jgi:hypothetical protein
MKSLVLLGAGLLLSGSVYAQSFEIGINGGVSTTGRANNALYSGTDNKWNYAADLSLHYNLSPRWQTGLSIGMTKWERETEWPLIHTNGDSLGLEDVNIVIAKRALSFALQLNHNVPFYDYYNEYIKSNVYFGVSAGAVVVGNDGQSVYSKVNSTSPVEYTYTSEFHFESGYGMLLGVQLGYTYFLSPKVGINFDFAPKVAWVRTYDSRYAGANNQYNILYFPTTIGLRFKIGNDRY